MIPCPSSNLFSTTFPAPTFLKEPRFTSKEGDDDEERDTAHGGTSQEPADEVSPGRVHIDVVVFERCVLAQGEEKSGLERQGRTDADAGGDREPSLRRWNTVRYTGASGDGSVEAPRQTVSQGVRHMKEGRETEMLQADRQKQTSRWNIGRPTDPAGLPRKGWEGRNQAGW